MTSKEWEKFDDDLERFLGMTLTGPEEKKLEIMTRMIFTIVEDIFRVENKQPQRTVYHPSRREREITNTRKELRTLANRYRRSGEEEKKGLIEIRIGLRRQLKGPRKKERIRKKQTGKEQKESSFVRNPYKFASSGLEGKRPGKLDKPREEVKAYLKETNSDDTRDKSLRRNNRIEDVPPPQNLLNAKEPTWKEIKEVVKKAQVQPQNQMV